MASEDNDSLDLSTLLALRQQIEDNIFEQHIAIHLVPQYKLIFLGSQNVGKTSLITRFMFNSFNNEQATVGIDFLSKTINVEENNKDVELQLWDTAGQERFRSIETLYMRNAAVVVVVYDISDSDSFEEAMYYWVADAKMEYDDDVVIMLVGNKRDLHHKRQVSAEIAEEKAQELGVMFMETSAKTGYNVNQLFQSVAAQLQEKHALSRNPDNLVIHKSCRSIDRCCSHHHRSNDQRPHQPSLGKWRKNMFEDDDDFCLIDDNYMRTIQDENDENSHNKGNCVIKKPTKVSESILRKSPEVDDVYELLKHKSSRWSDIGREFRVSEDFREELRSLIYLTNRDKLERVIGKWVESESIDVTWNALIAVLTEVELIDIVRKVRGFLLAPETIEKYSLKEDFNQL